MRGGYPELVAESDRDITLWHSSYVQTYLERDVRSFRQIGDLISFQSFLRALAARSGQLLNLTNIARDPGVAVNTAKAWLSILEATFQVIVLRPYHANIGKRLVKTPKVYLNDTGTLCYLADLRDLRSTPWRVRWAGQSLRPRYYSKSSKRSSTGAKTHRFTCGALLQG